MTVQLVSKIPNLCDPDPPTLQTDRQTDRRTTCNLNTALCTSASRGKNVPSVIPTRFETTPPGLQTSTPAYISESIATRSNTRLLRSSSAPLDYCRRHLEGRRSPNEISAELHHRHETIPVSVLDSDHTSELRAVTCHMGSHRRVTCHQTQVNAPRLTPTMQAGTRFTYPGGMEG